MSQLRNVGVIAFDRRHKFGYMEGALRRYHPEFGQMAADRIDGLDPLTHQETGSAGSSRRRKSNSPRARNLAATSTLPLKPRPADMCGRRRTDSINNERGYSRNQIVFIGLHLAGWSLPKLAHDGPDRPALLCLPPHH